LAITGVSAQGPPQGNPQSFVVHVPNVMVAASGLPIKIGDETIGGVGLFVSLGATMRYAPRQTSTKPPSISSKRGGS